MNDIDVRDGVRASNRRPVVHKIRGRLASIVLIFEAIVILLATLVVAGLKVLPLAVSLVGGLSLCGALLAVVGVVRFGWGVAAGWVLQAAIVATGIIAPAMIAVGSLFVLEWTACMIIGAKLDRLKPPKEKP